METADNVLGVIIGFVLFPVGVLIMVGAWLALIGVVKFGAYSNGGLHRDAARRAARRGRRLL